MRREPPQELTAAACVVDVHQDVRAKVRLRSIAQYRCLDLVQIKRSGTVVLSSSIALFQNSHHILLLKLQIKSDGRDTNARSVRDAPSSRRPVVRAFAGIENFFEFGYVFSNLCL